MKEETLTLKLLTTALSKTVTVGSIAVLTALTSLSINTQSAEAGQKEFQQGQKFFQERLKLRSEPQGFLPDQPPFFSSEEPIQRWGRWDNQMTVYYLEICHLLPDNTDIDTLKGCFAAYEKTFQTAYLPKRNKNVALWKKTRLKQYGNTKEANYILNGTIKANNDYIKTHIQLSKKIAIFTARQKNVDSQQYSKNLKTAFRGQLLDLVKKQHAMWLWNQLAKSYKNVKLDKYRDVSEIMNLLSSLDNITTLTGPRPLLPTTTNAGNPNYIPYTILDSNKQGFIVRDWLGKDVDKEWAKTKKQARQVLTATLNNLPEKCKTTNLDGTQDVDELKCSPFRVFLAHAWVNGDLGPFDPLVAGGLIDDIAGNTARSRVSTTSRTSRNSNQANRRTRSSNQTQVREEPTTSRSTRRRSNNTPEEGINPCLTNLQRNIAINTGYLIASTDFDKLRLGLESEENWLEARNCLKDGWQIEFKKKYQGTYYENLPIDDIRGDFKFEPPSLKNGRIDFDKIKPKGVSGLVDSKGRVWKIDPESISQGNMHWDVQTYNRRQGKYLHTNVNPNGTINHGANNFNNF